MSRVRHSPSWGRSREPGHTRRIDAARRAALRGRGRDCTARDPELSAEQTAPTRRSLPGACTVPQPASAHCSERAPQQCLRPRAVLRPQSPSRVPTLHSCTGHCCSHRPVPVSSRFQSRLARCRKGEGARAEHCSLCVVCATVYLGCADFFEKIFRLQCPYHTSSESHGSELSGDVRYLCQRAQEDGKNLAHFLYAAIQ